MKAKKCFALLLAALSLLGVVLAGFGAGGAASASGSGKYSEGVNARCEITGYHRYQGENSGCFLSKGDKVAVISPSELPTRKRVDATVNGLRAWGFVPVTGKYVCPQTRTLDELIADLTWALNDPAIKAVFCVRGGSGASDVMDAVALELIRNANKPIIGYSDITVYHSAWAAAGVPSIHAGMSDAFTYITDACAKAERRMMTGDIPSYRCTANTPCVNGEATGVLLGGNLSTFVSVLGTEYDCTRTDQPYILFFEDVDDNMREIHRYLTILKHLGVLDRASGIVFGEWTDLPVDGEGNFGAVRGGTFQSVADMIYREFLVDPSIPVAFDFPAGHARVNYPLLMGETVKLSVSDGVYTLEWVEGAKSAGD